MTTGIPGGDSAINNFMKQSVILRFSEEMLHPRVDRPGHYEPPPADEVAAYWEWKAKFRPLFEEGSRRGWFSEGGPEYGFEYEPPEKRWVFDDK
jgi:hypothetical protein